MRRHRVAYGMVGLFSLHAIVRALLIVAAGLMVAGFAPLAVAAQRAGGVNCLSDPELGRFAEYLGTWEVFDEAGEVRGVQSYEFILDGCAVLERWAGADGWEGQAFIFYDRAAAEWRHTYVDNRGNSTIATGGFADGVLRFSGRTSRQWVVRWALRLQSTDTLRIATERFAEADRTWSLLGTLLLVRRR